MSVSMDSSFQQEAEKRLRARILEEYFQVVPKVRQKELVDELAKILWERQEKEKLLNQERANLEKREASQKKSAEGRSWFSNMGVAAFQFVSKALSEDPLKAAVKKLEAEIEGAHEQEHRVIETFRAIGKKYFDVKEAASSSDSSVKSKDRTSVRDPLRKIATQQVDAYFSDVPEFNLKDTDDFINQLYFELVETEIDRLLLSEEPFRDDNIYLINREHFEKPDEIVKIHFEEDERKALLKKVRDKNKEIIREDIEILKIAVKLNASDAFKNFSEGAFSFSEKKNDLRNYILNWKAIEKLKRDAENHEALDKLRKGVSDFHQKYYTDLYLEELDKEFDYTPPSMVSEMRRKLVPFWQHPRFIGALKGGAAGAATAFWMGIGAVPIAVAGAAVGALRPEYGNALLGAGGAMAAAGTLGLAPGVLPMVMVGAGGAALEVVAEKSIKEGKAYFEEVKEYFEPEYRITRAFLLPYTQFKSAIQDLKKGDTLSGATRIAAMALGVIAFVAINILTAGLPAFAIGAIAGLAGLGALGLYVGAGISKGIKWFISERREEAKRRALYQLTKPVEDALGKSNAKKIGNYFENKINETKALIEKINQAPDAENARQDLAEARDYLEKLNATLKSLREANTVKDVKAIIKNYCRYEYQLQRSHYLAVSQSVAISEQEMKLQETAFKVGKQKMDNLKNTLETLKTLVGEPPRSPAVTLVGPSSDTITKKATKMVETLEKTKKQEESKEAGTKDIKHIFSTTRQYEKREEKKIDPTRHKKKFD